MSDFQKADSSVYTTFLSLIEKTFPELSGYSFGLLFKQTAKKSRGRMTLAYVTQPTKLMSFFAKDDKGNPFDVLMVVDEMVWACASDEDRIRLIRHELRHCRVNDKGNLGMVDHDFQDFYEEVELNADNPHWASKLAEVATAGYKQVKDGQKDPRLDRRDKEDLAPVDKPIQKQTQLDAVDPNFTQSAISGHAKKAGADVAAKLFDVHKGRDKGSVNTTEIAAKAAGQFDGKDKPSDVFMKLGDLTPGQKVDELARKRGLIK